jgi:hypothetical protein
LGQSVDIAVSKDTSTVSIVTAAGRTKALGGRNEAEADGGAERRQGTGGGRGKAEARRGGDETRADGGSNWLCNSR